MINEWGVLTENVEEMLASREAILRATARRVCWDNDEYEDVLQEGRFIFWKIFSSLEGEPLEVRTRFAIHAAQQRMRQVMSPTQRVHYLGHASGTGTSEVTKVVVLDAPVSTDNETSIKDLLEAVDALGEVEMAYHHGQIMRAINGLPDAQREYVYLRFWEGYSEVEIAARQGLSTSGAHMRWTRQIRPHLQQALLHLSSV